MVRCLEMKMSSGARDPVVGLCVITVALTVHFGLQGRQGALEYGSEQCMFGLRLGYKTMG